MSYPSPDSSPSRQFDFAAFRRRLWIVLVCAVIGAAGLYIHARRTPKRYSANAELLFGANASLSQLLGIGGGGSQDATTVAATNVQLASLPILSTLTANALGSKASAGGVSVKVAPAGVSNLVSVTATSPTPALAAQVANVYSQQFIAYTKRQQSSAVAQAISALRTEIQHGGVPNTPLTTLRATLSQLEGIAAVEPVDVQLAASAVAPTSPASPHPTTEAILGALIGGIIGLMAALLADRVDPRLHSLRTLASGDTAVNLMPWIEGVRPLSRQSLLGTPGRSAIRALRRILQTTEGRRDRSGTLLVLVTSAPGRGEARSRTAVAWGLARSAAMAATEGAVIMVQLAEDEGEFAERLRLADRHGWVDVLDGRSELSDAIETVEFGGGRDRAPRHIDLLLRPGVRRAHATLDDEVRFRRLVSELASRYQCIVLEAPPTDGLDAAAFLVGEVDSVVAVSRLHHSRRDAIEQLVASLSSQRADGIYLVGSIVGASGGSFARRASVPELVSVDVEEPEPGPYDALVEHFD